MTSDRSDRLAWLVIAGCVAGLVAGGVLGERLEEEPAVWTPATGSEPVEVEAP